MNTVTSTVRDQIVSLLLAEKPHNYIDGDGTVRIDKRWLSVDDLGLEPEDVPYDDRYYRDTCQDTPGTIVVLRSAH